MRKQKDIIDNHKNLEEKIELMKNGLARKEAMLRSANEQLEKMKVELLSTKEINASKILDLEKQCRFVML